MKGELLPHCSAERAANRECDCWHPDIGWKNGCGRDAAGGTAMALAFRQKEQELEARVHYSAGHGRRRLTFIPDDDVDEIMPELMQIFREGNFVPGQHLHVHDYYLRDGKRLLR